jgi:copper chaperone CopZ
MRVKIDAPRGHGKLHRVEEELRQMPATLDVQANHRARSVTVTYDPRQVSAAAMLEQLHRLGLIALDITNPIEWGEMLAENVVPEAKDPNTLPGRLNQELLLTTGGKLDLFRLTTGLLLVSVGIQVRQALLRGDAIPWMRVLTYSLAAASIWSRRKSAVEGQ